MVGYGDRVSGIGYRVSGIGYRVADYGLRTMDQLPNIVIIVKSTIIDNKIQ